MIHRLCRLLGLGAILLAGGPAVATAPTGRFMVTSGSGGNNGTVYDTKTKLTWQQTVTSTTYTWANAKTYCAGVGSSLGGTGWRLPTVKELQSILDFTLTSTPMFPSPFAQSQQLIQYWTLTVAPTGTQTSPGYAYYVDSWLGGVNRQDPTATYGARCVR
jgi:hypothetical protein